MSIALDEMTDVTVERIRWAPNQARTLEAFHAINVDNPAVLAEGAEVTYTDEDLGECFVGRITDVKEAWRNGEGVRYTCADAYRTLTKTPASILQNNLKQTRLEFATGTSIKTIIEAIFAGSDLDAFFPCGLNWDLTDANTAAVDKAGQGFDTWLNDLLENTPGGIAWVDPNAGCPRLMITDFTAAPEVDLTVGQFNVINPATGELLFEGGDFGKSLNRKYYKVAVQGCGYFKRYELRYLTGTLVEANPDQHYWIFRWYIPDSAYKRVTCRWIDASGGCHEDCKARFKFGSNPDEITLGPMVFDWENPVIQTDLDDGRKFIQMIVQLKGWEYPGQGHPTPNVSCWLTYTIEEGPMLAEVTSSDPNLAGEGTYVEQHPEFIKYEGPTGNIDQSALLTSLANALAARYCDAADLTGSFGVHINGINTDLTLGSPISNFAGARTQTIEYDLVSRSMNISVSTIPLRDAIKIVKQQLKDGTLEGGNWYQNRVVPVDGCLCDGEVTTSDENGRGRRGDDGDDGKRVKKSWDCDRQAWVCNEVPGDAGRFKTWGDCDAACKGPELPWKFVRCVGCVAAQGIADGQYRTIDDCNMDHQEPSDGMWDGCKYHCDPGLGCVPGQAGEYDTLEACKAACKQTGSGYGTSSGGVGSGSSAPPLGSGSGGYSWGCPCSTAIKGLSIGPNGQVLGVSCAPVTPAAAGIGTSGYCVGETQTVTVLKDIVLNGDGTWTKTYVELKYCGEPPYESQTNESCACTGGYGT